MRTHGHQHVCTQTQNRTRSGTGGGGGFRRSRALLQVPALHSRVSLQTSLLPDSQP
ncbi:Uncharacterized protein DAT39_017862 [Clarias magur]|uniref:Uncharacterized protein n=1 Tax=Clarias magur TaxID=1594786 RepID=A0A8J4U802_CLAMG|nr:Uncharacterized protein DAT39_017862 [Clarias magur]